MTGNVKPFYMVQLWLDVRGLFRLGRRLGLVQMRRPVDLQYLVHCALGELFQKQAPGPFSVEGNVQSGRWIRVLGYADDPWEKLCETAQLFADPDTYALCDWERGASKPMPTLFQKGMRLGFNVRVCPVIRKASAGKSPAGRAWKSGQEIDVFLSEAWSRPEAALSREAVYVEWLRRQMSRSGRGGAVVESARIVRFGLEPMIRRTRGTPRQIVALIRPDVVFDGVLTITDGTAFLQALRHGIGRHRHFGYGMIKLRRA